MKTTLLLTLALAATPTLAGDCPTPKRLTCAELAQKMTERCPPDYDGGCPECNCPDPVPCPDLRVVEKRVEVPVPGPERLVDHFIFQDVYKEPKGRPLLRYGASYIDGPGLALGGGYRFKSGIDLVATAHYQKNHGDTAHLFDRELVRGCYKYYPVSLTPDRYNVGIGLDITIPLGGK